jgi:hypothetical protein
MAGSIVSVDSVVRLDSNYSIQHLQTTSSWPMGVPARTGIGLQFLMPWDEAEQIRGCWQRREIQRLTVELPGGKSVVGTVFDVSPVPMLDHERGLQLLQSVLVLLETPA